MTGSIVLTEFARKRLFPRKGRLQKIQGATPDEFEQYLNAITPEAVLDGYAPFCKLHVHKNWTSTLCMTVPITDENRHLLRSGYEARVKEELPVLTRWFEGVEPPRAKYLIAILYSREQLKKENDAVDADWGMVGCLPVAQAEETPIGPITMMRNALGVDQGGSGVPLDEAAYRKSVEFWEKNATWRTSKA